MPRLLASALLFCLLLWAGSVKAQTSQQDRRIEEEKREDLKPTVKIPPTPAALVPIKEPPVPQPFKELYFISLLPKRVTFRYDAAKAIVILMGVDEEYIDLSSQVAYLQAQGFLPQRYQQAFDPMQPLRKGLLAYILYRALHIKGGIALHLFGPTQRHALKELAFRGMMSPGRVNDLVTGEELVQAMSQMAEYKIRHQPTQVP